MRVAAIIVGLAVAGLPALAQAPSYADRPSAARTAAQGGSENARRQRQTRGQSRRRPPPWQLMRPCRKPNGSPSRRISPGSTPMKAAPAAISTTRPFAAVKTFQSRNSGKPTGVLTAQERDLLATAAKSREDNVGWRVIEDTATGARLGVPIKLVPRTERPGSAAASARPRARSGSRPSASPRGRCRRCSRTRRNPRSAKFIQHAQAAIVHHFRRARLEGLCRSRRGERQRIARRHRALRSGHRRHHGPGRGGDRRYIRGISRSQYRAAAG